MGAARSHRRGHGPARLDGQEPRATVAGSVMKERERRTTGQRPNDQIGVEPTPRGERHCVPQARLTKSEQSAQREIDTMHRPIRCNLFGGILGRQVCAAGWAASRPLEASAARSLSRTPRAKQKGGNAPLGHISPRSAIDRMSLPATIR